jgi:hypothetical protein
MPSMLCRVLFGRDFQYLLAEPRTTFLGSFNGFVMTSVHKYGKFFCGDFCSQAFRQFISLSAIQLLNGFPVKKCKYFYPCLGICIRCIQPNYGKTEGRCFYASNHTLPCSDLPNLVPSAFDEGGRVIQMTAFFSSD